MNEKPCIADPKDSSTVILVREDGCAPCEVFLACRHERQSFMAGAYVFPGGRVDDSDFTLTDRISVPAGFDAPARLQDDTLSSARALALFICAIRETFEETGILIAHTADGQPPDGQCLILWRNTLRAGRKSFRDLVRDENLFFPLDVLVPYAHWITPEILPKRFATRFFLTALPPGQSATTDNAEMTDCLWIAPKEALRLYRKQDILLMPPTIKTLDELSVFATLDELLAFTRQKTFHPVLPQPAGNLLKLPHDPEYGIAPFRTPPCAGEPSRLILADGIWQTGFYPQK